MNDHPATPTTPITVLNSTAALDQLAAGDVIELDVDGDPNTALVLLATEHALILDTCDGSTPFVIRTDELGPHRKFNPAA